MILECKGLSKTYQGFPALSDVSFGIGGGHIVGLLGPNGRLPVLKVGRKTIIRRDTLERFLTVNQGRNLLKPDDVRRVE